MKNEEKVDKVRAFLKKDDLSGTDLNLKNKCVELDIQVQNVSSELKKAESDMLAARKEMEERNIFLHSLSQKLEGLCELIVSLDGE